MSDLDALIARVEAGEKGPVVDMAVMSAIGREVTVNKRGMQQREPGRRHWESISPVSGSLDACDWLRRKILPGVASMSVNYFLGCEAPGDRWEVVIRMDLAQRPHRREVNAPTECAARLAALLRAYREINHE